MARTPHGTRATPQAAETYQTPQPIDRIDLVIMLHRIGLCPTICDQGERPIQQIVARKAQPVLAVTTPAPTDSCPLTTSLHTSVAAKVVAPTLACRLEGAQTAVSNQVDTDQTIVSRQTVAFPNSSNSNRELTTSADLQVLACTRTCSQDCTIRRLG